MNGVQFYLRRPVRMVRGHTIHIDTEWALTSISQIDVWRPGTMDRYGPQTIHEHRVGGRLRLGRPCAERPHRLRALAARRSCREVWRQLKRSMNVAGEEEILRDDDLIGWFLDSDIDRDPTHPGWLTNTEPLLVNLVDSWRLRPDAADRHPEPLPRVRLRADAHRPGDDGGGERGGPARRQRDPRSRRPRRTALPHLATA